MFYSRNSNRKYNGNLNRSTINANKQEQQLINNKNQKNVGPIKKERLSLDQHNLHNNQGYSSQQPLNLSVEATQFNSNNNINAHNNNNNRHHNQMLNNEDNLDSQSLQV